MLTVFVSPCFSFVHEMGYRCEFCIENASVFAFIYTVSQLLGNPILMLILFVFVVDFGALKRVFSSYFIVLGV